MLDVDRPTLVLGSTQPEASVDPVALARAGVTLARRRSGGGAVLLVPGEHVWVDVVVPSGDPLFVHDVEEATWWLGEAWSRALGRVTSVDLRVHDRGVTDRRVGRIVCFAALGPGEVSTGGSKVVGMSQRRSRSLVRLQCLVHRRFDPRSTLSLLAEVSRTTDMIDALVHRVSDLEGLGVDLGWDVVEGLRAELP